MGRSSGVGAGGVGDLPPAPAGQLRSPRHQRRADPSGPGQRAHPAVPRPALEPRPERAAPDQGVPRPVRPRVRHRDPRLRGARLGGAARSLAERCPVLLLRPAAAPKAAGQPGAPAQPGGARVAPRAALPGLSPAGAPSTGHEGPTSCASTRLPGVSGSRTPGRRLARPLCGVGLGSGLAWSPA